MTTKQGIRTAGIASDVKLKVEDETSTAKRFRLGDFVVQGIAIAAVVLATTWVLDLMIDFEGRDRWMLFIIVPLSTVAGLIVAAMITGITYFDQE
jgi:hypothetical protein